MPNARIEIESVRTSSRETWHAEVESYPPARRRVINAATFDDCIAAIVRGYNAIRPDGVPAQTTPSVDEQPAAPTDQGDVIESGDLLYVTDGVDPLGNDGHAIQGVNAGLENIKASRRGRHPNSCTCERCEAKRAAA